MALLTTPRTPQRSDSRSSFRVRFETRLAPRVAHRVACRIQIVADESSSLIGRTINLSQGGMSVQVPAMVSRDTEVHAWVAGPGGATMQVRGVVVHSRRIMADAYELGIRFLRPTQA